MPITRPTTSVTANARIAKMKNKGKRIKTPAPYPLGERAQQEREPVALSCHNSIKDRKGYKVVLLRKEKGLSSKRSFLI